MLLATEVNSILITYKLTNQYVWKALSLLIWRVVNLTYTVPLNSYYTWGKYEMQLLFYGLKYFCTHCWITFKNSLNDKSLITICRMTFRSRFQGLVWDLQVRFWETVSYGTVHKNLIFNTAKTSNHFGHENKSQKNTISPCWMKLMLVVQRLWKLN